MIIKGEVNERGGQRLRSLPLVRKRREV